MTGNARCWSVKKTVRSEKKRNKFRAALLEWFDGHRRDLPWRGEHDPYAVWVSEVMLQQTRVQTVVDYFERWMERFPTVEALAEASVEEVLQLWSGLGYYRRARYLHRGAQQVVEQRDGQVPSTVDELRELPGIGPYTAGAIASIAFGRVEPLVDGNVMRVIARLFTIEGKPRRSPAKQQIWDLAGKLVDSQRPGDFNQALMELGSQVCTTASPQCTSCVVRPFCAAFAEGEPTRYPQTRDRPDQKPMRARCCVVFYDDGEDTKFLLRRRPETGLLSGLWEFPGVEYEGETWPGVEALAERLREGCGQPVGQLQQVPGEVTHLFSHRRLQVQVHQLELSRAGQAPQGWRWVSAQELPEVASSALLKKVQKLWRNHR